MVAGRLLMVFHALIPNIAIKITNSNILRAPGHLYVFKMLKILKMYFQKVVVVWSDCARRRRAASSLIGWRR